MANFTPSNELAFDKKEDALKVVEVLLENKYVVMVSLEENLYIVNWLYSPLTDRNDVVFMDRGEFEDEFFS